MVRASTWDAIVTAAARSSAAGAGQPVGVGVPIAEVVDLPLKGPDFLDLPLLPRLIGVESERLVVGSGSRPDDVGDDGETARVPGSHQDPAGLEGVPTEGLMSAQKKP